MERFRLEYPARNMEIDHRGQDIGASHALLHRADINAMLEKRGGEVMAERVKAG